VSRSTARRRSCSAAFSSGEAMYVAIGADVPASATMSA
jgi:hypothetical protein